ncbi:hypothetical protein L484_027740 [Morus notabilis]|uniref:Uncharacterized protein n=1 Tax=Morus notabilis TaxID=981085 RepID=W9RCU1_9ROSA|nr:hypothetical protein L484_027740 [Morus notabilis]
MEKHKGRKERNKGIREREIGERNRHEVEADALRFVRSGDEQWNEVERESSSHLLAGLLGVGKEQVVREV